MTIAIAAARAEFDSSLLARRAEGLPSTPAPDLGSGAGNGVSAEGVGRGASLLAALVGRQDAMAEIATSVRAAGQADAQGQDLANLRKLYPPYPREFEERARNLEKLIGVRQLNESLSPQPTGPDGREPLPVDLETLKQSIRQAVMATPSRGLTERVNAVASFLDA